ncbi:MAG: GntR family transcriptional regulator [Bacilli bacterium]
MKQIMINLDYQSRVPIYEQIVNNIEKYVALGILEARTQIPSIREMASNLGINPNTVKKSYDILESNGVITTISTKGTFIADDTKKTTNDKIEKEINIIRDKINELTKMGIRYDEIIERIKK